MRQIIKKLKQAQISYVLFNISIILISLTMAATLIASHFMEDNILMLGLDITWNSLNMWLLVGIPMILLAIVAIFSFLNYLFYYRANEGVKVKKYYIIKRNLDFSSAIVWIIIILIVATLAVVTGGLFVHKAGEVNNWDRLGFNTIVERDIYLQIYVFSLWAITFFALIIGLVVLSYNYYTRQWVIFNSKESTHDTKIIPLAEKEIDNIKGTIRVIEKEMTNAEQKTQKLSSLFARLQTEKVPLSRKVLRDVEQTKSTFYKDSYNIKLKIAQLERTLENVNDLSLHSNLVDLKPKVNKKETKVKKIATSKVVKTTKTKPIKKPAVTQAVAIKTTTTEPKLATTQTTKVATTQTTKVATKRIPLKKSAIKKTFNVISQNELIHKMYESINNNLSIGDVKRFNEKIIREFVNNFSEHITSDLAKKKNVVINNVLGMKHYISKPTTKTNPQNPQETINVPAKNKIRISFANNFKSNIDKDHDRPEIKWDKKMTQNMETEKAWDKVANNVEKLLKLTKDELFTLASYANVKIDSNSKKEDIVDELKYIDAKYFKKAVKESK